MAEKFPQGAAPQENKMGALPIGRLLTNMAVPMMISMLVQACYNVVDSVFVAQISEDALNAVSLAFPLQNLMIAFGAGTAVGINALLSRSLGEKNQAMADRAANTGIFLALCNFALFALIGIFFSRTFFELQAGGEQVIIDYGVDYASICLGCSIGIFSQFCFERLLQSTGRTFLAMCTQLTGALINIVLDPILIFGWFGLPRMEVAGAAIATVAGQIVAAAAALVLNLKCNPDIHILPREIRWHGKVAAEIYRVGFPSIVMQSIGSAMVFGMNKILFSFTKTATAVFGAYFKLQSFVFMPVFGLNNGMVPIIGYNYGARNQIDYDIPEIQYGLSQEFLETSLNNPYLSSGIQYGLSDGSATTVYPESDFSNSSIISGGSLIEVPYQPSVTITDLKQKDGSIGKVSIDRVSLSCKVYEGATDSSMSKGAGHYTSSGIYTGNIGLFGHNRGSHAYFAKLKNVKIGDIVEYKTAIGTKTYQVTFVGSISYTDYSYLNEMGDNRITLITCIANQPSLRLCVQAVEIR